MRTNTLLFLHNKLKLNSIFLAFITAIVLSACGVKGDLYQTPKQGEIKKETSEVESTDQQKPKDNPVSVSSPHSTAEQ